jgi:urease accessory protein
LGVLFLILRSRPKGGVSKDEATDRSQMNRVTAIKLAGTWTGVASDRVVLDADDRQRRRIVLTGEKGTKILLDFEKPVTLRDGDGLVLDHGTIVVVAGKPEPLVEITARTPLDVVRLAWHLGNRHTDVQIVGDKLRIRRDHVLEEMTKGLGAEITPLEAPFEPEGGAHASHGHDHGG